MSHPEPVIIADVFDRARALNRWYLRKFSDEQRLIRPRLGEHTFNSARWIAAHLTWAEANLLLRSTGGQVPAIPWLDAYAIGSDAEKAERSAPSMADIEAAMDEVHQLALAHVRSLDPDTLGEPFGLPMFKTRRDGLYHAIRHEATHTGHLSWLAKMLGIPTV
jgi:uncharacterized damage-inducible protein DinB